jgi:hypothetical protein
MSVDARKNQLTFEDLKRLVSFLKIAGEVRLLASTGSFGRVLEDAREKVQIQPLCALLQFVCLKGFFHYEVGSHER